ncbi:unnamed protein product, partial [marine sediment metagenome]
MSKKRLEKVRLDTLEGTLVAQLAGSAMAAISFARAPLSGYRVGAAVLDKHGNIYLG